MFKNKKEEYKKLKKLIDCLDSKIENNDIHFTIMSGLEHFVNSKSAIFIITDNFFEGYEKDGSYSFKLHVDDNRILIEELKYYGRSLSIWNVKFIDKNTIVTIFNEIENYIYHNEKTKSGTKKTEELRLYIDNLLRYEKNFIHNIDLNVYSSNDMHQFYNNELYINSSNEAVYYRKSESSKNISIGDGTECTYTDENVYYKMSNNRKVYYNNLNNDPSIFISGLSKVTKEEFENMKNTQLMTQRLVEENNSLEKISTSEEVKPTFTKIKKIFDKLEF